MGGVCARVTSALLMERNDPDSAFPLYIGRIRTDFFACGANTPTEAAVPMRIAFRTIVLNSDCLAQLVACISWDQLLVGPIPGSDFEELAAL